MEFFVFIIPVITCLILLFKYRKETVWWEYALVAIPSIIIFFVLKYSIIGINAFDIEYHGNIINKAIYYEDWDETVMVAHHYYTGSGKHRHCHTYYVPERRYHPEQFRYTLKNDSSKIFSEYDMSKEDFRLVIQQLRARPIFKDMHRVYRSKDGDAYEYYWDNSYNNAYMVTSTHEYFNKVKAAKYSLFKYNHLTDDDIKNNHLYEYPDIKNLDQNPIIGQKRSYLEEHAIKYINGYYGPTKQFRMYVLLYDTISPEVSEMQKAYWEGGNKNEFILCLGVHNDSIMWCNPFSWSDAPTLEVMSRSYFNEHPKLDLVRYAEWLKPNIEKHWIRKSFKDFNYLSIELSPITYIIIFILIIIYNIGISIYVVKNEYVSDDYYNMKKGLL